MSSDFYGNFVITGKFGNHTSFGDITLSSIGTANTFVVKTDLDTVIWAKQIPGTGLNEGRCIYYGQNESIYIGGTLRDSIYVNQDTLNAESGKDYYFSKLSDHIDHSIYLNIPPVNYDFTTLSVYPNPSRGLISINASSPLESVQIFDLNGRLINQFFITQLPAKTRPKQY